MAPTYRDGDRVLVHRGRVELRPGLVAVVNDPSDVGASSRVVKRVAAVAGQAPPPQLRAVCEMVPPGRIVLLGDNAEASTDSRQYGCVEIAKIVGVVIRRLG